MNAAWNRLRPALGELALAFAGLLLGSAALLVLSSIGLMPSGEEGELHVVNFIGGPAVTAIAALFYRWISRKLDEPGPPRPSHQLGRPPADAEPQRDADARGDPAFEERRERTSVPVALSLAVLGIIAALVGSFSLGALMELLGFPVEEQEAILQIIEQAREQGAVFQLVALAVAATVLAPVAEEWLFRGTLFRRLLRVSGRPEAYLLSASAFAMIHLNLAGFVVYLWLGLVFAYTYRRTGRLWTAMLVHTGNNAVALTLLLMA